MSNFICKKCRSTEYEIKDKPNGTGIAHGLYCAKCGFWHKWIGKEELKLYDKKDNKDDIVALLQAENDELKARLEKALELACKVGDTIYCIFGTTEIKSWEVEKITLCEDWYSITCGHTGADDYICLLSKEYDIWWFTDRVKAKARLAELNSSCGTKKIYNQ